MTTVATPRAMAAANARAPAWCASMLLAAVGLILACPPIGRMFMPFAVLTAQLTAILLELSGLTVTRTATTLIHSQGFACEIDLACTALLPASLLVLVLIAWRARPTALVIGALFMVAVNQWRLVGLVWFGVYSPGHLDLAHAVGGPMLLILAGLGYICLWRRTSPR